MCESKEITADPRGEILDKWRPHLSAVTRGAEYLFRSFI